MNSEWTAYAIDFVSFVIHKLEAKDREVLRSIILFGSTARGETDAKSDVDLFFDTKDARRLESRVKRLLDEFESSIKVARYWKLLGVSPTLSLIVEDLEAWDAAHAAILKDGRVLFGVFNGIRPSLGQAWAIVSWRESAGLKQRTNLHRRLEGYKARGKRYPGLLERHGGEKLSKGTIVVHLSGLEPFKGLFRELAVPIRMRVMYELAAGSPSGHRDLGGSQPKRSTKAKASSVA
jgi:predicted nucleotidyltransferase